MFHWVSVKMLYSQKLIFYVPIRIFISILLSLPTMFLVESNLKYYFFVIQSLLVYLTSLIFSGCKLNIKMYINLKLNLLHLFDYLFIISSLMLFSLNIFGIYFSITLALAIFCVSFLP